MSWAKPLVEKLQKGETVSFRPKGNSMQGKIESGNLVTVIPDVASLQKDDIVLCKVKGSYYVHLITAIDGNRFQISNNKGHINGWVAKNSIFGRVSTIED